jgi:hypothetical protein
MAIASQRTDNWSYQHVNDRINHLSDQLDAILELLGAPRLSPTVAAQP